MAKYVLTNKAVSDLSSIWEYTYEIWSENQADKYYQLLVDGFEELAEAPDKGKSFEDIEAGLRGSRVAKHIIFYLIAEGGIVVVRVLHEQMDLRQHLNE